MPKIFQRLLLTVLAGTLIAGYLLPVRAADKQITIAYQTTVEPSKAVDYTYRDPWNSRPHLVR